MAITIVTPASAVVSAQNATTIVTTAPAHSIGDTLILAVGTKPDTSTPDTPSGWTLVGTTAGGTGTTGIDTGPTRVTVFSKIATATNDTAGTLNIPSNNVSWTQCFAYRPGAGNSIDIAYVGAADTTTGTAHTVTMASNPGITAGDVLLAIGVVPTDVGAGTQFSSEQVSATGLTTVSLTEVAEPLSSNNNDIGGWTAHATAVTGTASAAPTVSATAGGTTTNIAGPIGLVRLREVVVTSKSGSDSGTFSATEGSSVSAVNPPPSFTHLTGGGTTTDQTSYTTASVSPSANNVLFLTVHAYMATGSAPPPEPTITGNSATWTMQKRTEVDNSGTDMASMWVWTAPAGASPTAGTITIDFGATLVGAIAWSVEEADADPTTPVANAYSVTTASGVTVATVTYTNAMGSGTAGFSAFGAQGTAGFTPKSGWTELSDVTTVSTCRLETQFKSGTDTTAESTFAASRSGGIALEVNGAVGATPKSASDSGTFSATDSSTLDISDAPISKSASDSGTLSATETASATPTLPGNIGGVEPESHAHNPPLLAPNGYLYRITESDTASGNHPMAWKSTDGGLTWTEMDSGNRPTAQDMEGSWVAMDGSTVVFVVTRDDTVWYCPFNTTTDTWGTQETIDTGLSSSGVEQYASFTKNNDGTYWIFYSDTLGGANNQIAYRKRTGTNTYGTKSTAIGGSTSVSYTAPSVVKGASDVTHIFYKDDTNNNLLYKTLTAAGTLSSVTTVVTGTATDNIPHTNPVYIDNGGTEEVFCAYADASDILKLVRIAGGTQQTTETISTSAILMDPGSVTNGGTVAHLAVNGTTIYAVWADAATGDIKLRSRAINGTWSSVSTLWDSGANEAWYVYNNVYTYGGRIRMGYVYDVTHAIDISDLKYNELDLGAASGTNNVSGSDSGTFSATESTTVAGSSTSTDTGTLSATETRAISVTLSATDSGSISATDSSSLVIAAALSASDSGTISATDAAGTIVGSSASTDTGTFSATESRTIAVSVSTSDTGTISASDASTSALASTSTDTGSISATESTGIVVSVSATDAGTFSGTDASTSSSTLSTTDTGTLSATETASVFVPVSTTDSGTLSAVDASSIEAGGSFTLSSSDTGTFSATETASNDVSMTRTDSGTISATETSVSSGTVSTSDAGTISATDASTVFKQISSNDSGSLSATDNSFVTANNPGADSGVFTATETSDIQISGSVPVNASDTGTIQGSETTTVLVTLTRTDSGTMSATEGTAFAKTIASSDSGTLSGADSSVVGTSISSTDSGSLSATEGSSIGTVDGLPVQVWNGSAMVTGQMKVWNGTGHINPEPQVWDGNQFV